MLCSMKPFLPDAHKADFLEPDRFELKPDGHLQTDTLLIRVLPNAYHQNYHFDYKHR